jgi:hypothetical protein
MSPELKAAADEATTSYCRCSSFTGAAQAHGTGSDGRWRCVKCGKAFPYADERAYDSPAVVMPPGKPTTETAAKPPRTDGLVHGSEMALYVDGDVAALRREIERLAKEVEGWKKSLNWQEDEGARLATERNAARARGCTLEAHCSALVEQRDGLAAALRDSADALNDLVVHLQVEQWKGPQRLLETTPLKAAREALAKFGGGER